MKRTNRDKERDRERERQRERDTDRETERQRQRETDTERERATETEREGERQRQRERHRQTDRQTDEMLHYDCGPVHRGRITKVSDLAEAKREILLSSIVFDDGCNGWTNLFTFRNWVTRGQAL